MPTLKLAGKTPARTSAPSTRSTPKRKPAAAAPSTPKRKPTAAKAPARKPAAAVSPTPAEVTGSGRNTRLPEGMTKRDFERVIKDMQKAKAAKDAAAVKLSEAQALVNGMALDLLDRGVQMSVISNELDLSRQWMYSMLKKREEDAAASSRSRSRKPAAKQAAAKPTAKKRAAKPVAKSAPARKRPAGGRVRLAA